MLEPEQYYYLKIQTTMNNTSKFKLKSAPLYRFEVSKETGIKRIALSGGVFQNRFLREETIKKLSSVIQSIKVTYRSQKRY